MKISRLHIDQFAIEDFHRIARDDVGGDDLFIRGGNRSGKTLTVNALLYALYGPRATLGIQPGRRSDVQIQFDNGHELTRGGGGRSYYDGEETVERSAVEDKIQNIIGPEQTTALQFVHSETDKLPLARLSQDELIDTIRRVVESPLQTELEELAERRDILEQETEQLRRTERSPIQRELEEIDIDSVERRLEKIEHLQRLIETDQLQTIKELLLENEKLNSELEQLYNRKRTIEQEKRSKRRELREQRRYTDGVNELIVDAIEELTCPVCDHVVPEETAKNRLEGGYCPQCGRERSLDDLKAELEEKVETAGESIDELESQIEDLDDEHSEIEAEIEAVQAEAPELTELNDLAKHTLEEYDYDIEAVADRTERELEEHRAEIDRLKSRKQELQEELADIEQGLTEKETELEELDVEIDELREESFRDIIQDFKDRWTSNFEGLDPDLGLEIRIEEDGTVSLPGNEGPREYGELSTGEARLLNIAFAHTFAEAARGNDVSEDSFEVVILDEPFANLESERRGNAMQFIREADLQYIIASSNDELEQHFDRTQIVDLQTMLVQMTFEELL